MTTDNNAQESSNCRLHAGLFSWVLAMALLWHHTSSSNEVWEYWLHFDPLITPLITITCVTAFLAACYPLKRSIFTIFAVSAFLSFIVRMPWVPTHVMMEMFLFSGIIFTSIKVVAQHQASGSSHNSAFELYAPLGRWLLIGMYFFGTFHKINSSFLTPSSSCAIPYLKGLPIISQYADLLSLQYAAIYGTLILEFIAMLLLFSVRFKYYGMLLGMSFHFAIGISSYGTLAHFSTLAIGLHTLFLPSNSVSNYLRDKHIPYALKKKNTLIAITITCVMLEFLFARMAWWTAMNALFATYALPIIFFVARYGKSEPAQPGAKLVSRSWVINGLSILFILHNMTPYLGLRTTASVEMFSGLRTEGGESNHYLIGNWSQLFDYQDTVIEIVQSDDPYFQYLQENRIGIIPFQFQRYVLEESDFFLLPLVLKVNGQVIQIRSPDDLKKLTEEYFQPQSRIEKLYLDFREVDLDSSNACRH